MIKMLHFNFSEFFELLKVKDFFIKHKVQFLPILVMFTLMLFVSIYKSQKLTECTEIETEMQPVINLISDNEKIKFIQQHKFAGKSIKVTDFIRKASYRTYAEITNLETISEEKIGKISIKQIKLTGLFWHDIFILDFLEKIQNFSPGFINIMSIDINKFSKKITHRPIMKLEIVCRVFQKL